VLVAEDNERLAAMVAGVLAQAGYEVVVAHDGYSALTLAVEQHFDVLLTDLQMPGLTGDAVAERVRRVHPKLPMLLMTAYHSVDVGNHLWAAVIRKPFDPWALVAAIDTATLPQLDV
jgi:CheY-like chemotaxis protein